MTDEPTKPRPEDEDVVAQAAAAASAASAGPTAEVPNVAGRLAEEVATLQGQIADLTDRLLRAHAEMDNLRKRAAKESEDMARYAIQKFAADVVNVADNFERAINSTPENAAVDNPAFQSLLDGVSMTEREFLNVLERHGVKRISPLGEMFNPHQHQAVMETQDPSVPSGTIVQVFQMGYMIQDRVLRPAMVVVAKGGAKQPKPAATDRRAAAEDMAEAQTKAKEQAQDPSASGQPPKPKGYDPDDASEKPDDDIIL